MLQGVVQSITAKKLFAYFTVGWDFFLMLIFVLALIRLRRLDYYNVKDTKANQIQIRDFTVYMPSIPLAAKDYNNSP